MPVLPPLRPRKMFPPPTTRPICTPSACTSPNSAAVARITAPSIPKPPSAPHSASPLSLRTMRLYLSPGSGGGGTTVSSSLSRVGLMACVRRLLSQPVVRNAAQRPLGRRARQGVRHVVLGGIMRLWIALLVGLTTLWGCNSRTDVADGGGAASDALAADQAARVLAKVGDRTITLGDYAAAL